MPSCRLPSLVGAHQAEDHVGMLRERGPDLLAVDDVVVARASASVRSDRPGRSPRRVPNSPGTTILAGQDAGQVVCFCSGAVLDQDRPDHLTPKDTIRGAFGPRAFILEDELLRPSPSRPAEFLGPVRAEPAALSKLLLPLQQPFLGDVAGAATPALLRHLGWHVGRDPVAHFLLEGEFVGVEGQAHRRASLRLLWHNHGSRL